MIYEQLASIIAEAFSDELSIEEIETLLEKPKHSEMGDIAFPCFTLAKKLRKAPQQIASELTEKLHAKQIKEVNVVGGYVNIFLNQVKLTCISRSCRYGNAEHRSEKSEFRAERVSC